MRRSLPAAALLLAVAACGRDGAPAGRDGDSGPATPESEPAPGAGVANREATMPKVGDVAPDFRVKDHTGKERTLLEFRGKRVVLWFFPKADTGG